MNERTKELAKQAIANVHFWNAEKEVYEVGHTELIEFAELVAQQEREACWEIVSEQIVPSDYSNSHQQEPVAWWDGKESVVFAHDTIYTPNWTDYWTKPLYADPTPCKTCEALSMSVMADHVYHEQVCPKKEWVGLTTDERDALVQRADKLLDHIYEYGTASEGIRPRLKSLFTAVEAKLKEKNT